MLTPVYIKMDAHDQLFLSEGVCRQLEIIRYHPEVNEVNGLKKPEPPTVCVQFVLSFCCAPTKVPLFQGELMEPKVPMCWNHVS